MKYTTAFVLLLSMFAISCSKGGEINDGPRTVGSAQVREASLMLAPREGFGVRTETIRTLPLTHRVRAVAIVTPDPRRPEKLWIIADVYADEIGLLRAGQSAEVSMASAPRINFRSSVREVSQTINENTRTAKVQIDPGNEARRLQPGLFALVDFDGKLGECLALPESALIQNEGRNLVYVQVGESTFQPREVNLGRVADGFYEILGGVRAGERVVTSQTFLHGAVTRVDSEDGDVIVR